MKEKKKVKAWLDFVRRMQGWNCELVASAITKVGKHEVLVVYYKQISDNPDIEPCFRYEMIVDDEHRGGGVIR